jgi:aminodeoxyfutalosine synthase
MMTLTDLEPKAAARDSFTHAEALRVLACTDLVSVGLLGETARRAQHGDRVTYGQVLNVAEGVPDSIGEAREVRLTGRPASFDAAVAWVKAVVALAGEVPVTGFSAADLRDLAEGDSLVLADAARRLHDAGLAAVAALPIDLVDDAADLVRTIQLGDLAIWRVVVERAPALETRLALIERVASLQRETGAVRTFAPLPIVDSGDTPSTGYDDVRTIAVARLVCANVPSIQVDWALYGPKLAQVAIAYGADDLDNIAAENTLALGARRSPRQDIERQITAAFAAPAARDARFELVW